MTEHETHTSPNVTPDEVKLLETTLRKSECWLHADEICVTLLMSSSYAHKRWVRAAASASGWIISGNEGYKHVACATSEEIEHFENRINSQIDAMKTRVETVKLNKASLN